MRHSTTAFMIVGTGLLFCSGCSQHAASVQTDPSDSLRWLVGTWSGPIDDATFVAHYLPPHDGTLVSHSYVIAEGVCVFYEFEVFATERNGVFTLQPFPDGKRASAFELTELDPDAPRAVFENAQNDFPTRITYTRTTPNRLEIVLDDPVHSSPRRDVYNLHRCPDGDCP